MDRGSPDPREFREIFHDIVADNRRAVEMIRSMRSTLKKDITEHKPLLLNDLIEEIMPIVRNDSRMKNVSVDLALGVSLPSIRGDRIQLQHGCLQPYCQCARGDEGFRSARNADICEPGMPTGKSCWTWWTPVTGIPNERLDSIFEPLVTTKADALGMGLPLSRSIVISHNGRLWAENNIDGGATFHVALPVENNLTFAPTAGARSKFPKRFRTTITRSYSPHRR